MARRLAARSAAAGLAVGLAVLAVLTLWSTAITERTTDRVRRADRITAAWVDVFTHLTSEDAA
ncbi:MAG: hypothetical protein JXA67_10890, partial [Micromonosporaceae bacterium]|nr:hypothetical protein [Micromonosporaceae bacterium]